ncbi:hypothetical protein [Pseudomonas fluorescens]|nr:hypothetical protein [Pseudomonas fluorescens]
MNGFKSLLLATALATTAQTTLAKIPTKIFVVDQTRLHLRFSPIPRIQLY